MEVERLNMLEQCDREEGGMEKTSIRIVKVARQEKVKPRERKEKLNVPELAT